MILRFIVLSIDSHGCHTCKFIHDAPRNLTRAQWESLRRSARDIKHQVALDNYGAELIIEDVDRRSPEYTKYDVAKQAIIDRVLDKARRLTLYIERAR